MTEIKNANDIYEKQNEPEFLDLLVAQNYTYKRGKAFSLLCFFVQRRLSDGPRNHQSSDLTFFSYILME